MYSFSDLEPVCCSMSSTNCCFLTCIQISQETGQVVWYSHLFKNFPQFVMIHTVKGFAILNKAKVDFFWNSLAFLVTPRMLAIWSLVPLPFLNPAWTSRSSWFTHWIYCSPPQKTGWKKLVTFALQANPSIYIWTDTEKHSFKFDVLSNFASVAFVLCVIHLSGMPHRDLSSLTEDWTRVPCSGILSTGPPRKSLPRCLLPEWLRPSAADAQHQVNGNTGHRGIHCYYLPKFSFSFSALGVHARCG